MRDFVFKNLTSHVKKRRIISSSEIVDRQGMRSVIRRHFIGIVKEIKDERIPQLPPYVYILKEHNNKEQKEKFLFRIKGYVYLRVDERKFVIFFMRSLKITLNLIPQGLAPTEVDNII